MTKIDSMPLKIERILKLIVIVCTILVIGAHQSRGCTTPDGISGDCRAITLCRPLLDIIRSKGISSLEALSFMRASTCGYDGENPKVCCAPYTSEFTGNSRPELEPRPQSTERPYTKVDSSSPRSPATYVSIPIFEGRDLDKVSEAPKTAISGRKGNSNRYTSSSSLLPKECGREQPRNKIVGGDRTELDEFPWTVLLQYHSGKNMINGCGGVLINKRYVLTAAHCLLAIPAGWQLRHVLLGEYNTRTNPDCFNSGTAEEDCADHVIVTTIEQQITHPNYGKPSAFSNDIALLRLDRDIKMTRFVQPICLPRNPKPSDVYWASGWGQTETRAQSDVKLKIRLPHVDFHKCAKLYATKHFYLGEGQMCAGGTYATDTCKGDSGGPLMRQERLTSGPSVWAVEGLVSLGHSPCGVHGWPGVYTKVRYHVSWIKSHLKP